MPHSNICAIGRLRLSEVISPKLPCGGDSHRLRFTGTVPSKSHFKCDSPWHLATVTPTRPPAHRRPTSPQPALCPQDPPRRQGASVLLPVAVPGRPLALPVAPPPARDTAPSGLRLHPQRTCHSRGPCAVAASWPRRPRCHCGPFCHAAAVHASHDHAIETAALRETAELRVSCNVRSASRQLSSSKLESMATKVKSPRDHCLQGLRVPVLG